jgi:GNAT superfamily N-acetyltransferase
METNMSISEQRDNFCISTDAKRIDIDAVHAYLTRSYWAAGISREIVAKAVLGSICFGVYDGDAQVGFARIITDKATFAYLSDVYILEEYRGRGLSRWLMEVIASHPDVQDVRRFSLVTRDAHGLYEKFGFRPLAAPERHMEIFRPDIYK